MALIIEGVLWVENGDVLIGEDILNYKPDEILSLLQSGLEAAPHPLLSKAAGRRPDHYHSLTEFKIAVADYKLKTRSLGASKAMKADLVAMRRSEFDSKRAQLVLRMIDDPKIPYVCAFESCTESESLTIDHITPLSKGGGDELENLQFLCRRHNSAKGDKRDD